MKQKRVNGLQSPGAEKMIKCEIVLSDFMLIAMGENECGCLRDNAYALYFACRLGKRSIRKYKRYRIIPKIFFLWLRMSGICSQLKIPNCDSVVHDLQKIIGHEYLSESEICQSAGQYFKMMQIEEDCQIIRAMSTRSRHRR